MVETFRVQALPHFVQIYVSDKNVRRVEIADGITRRTLPATQWPGDETFEHLKFGFAACSLRSVPTSRSGIWPPPLIDTARPGEHHPGVTNRSAKAFGAIAAAAMFLAAVCYYFGSDPDPIVTHRSNAVDGGAASPDPRTQIGRAAVEDSRFQAQPVQPAPVTDRRYFGLSEKDVALLKTAKEDFGAAIRLIEETYPEESRQRAISWVAGEIARENLAVLSLAIPKLTDPGHRQLAFAIAAERWVLDDLPKVIAAARNFQAGTARTEFYYQIAEKLRKNGLFAPAVSLIEEMPGSTLRLRAIGGLASGWSRSDPPAAMAWTNALASTEDRSEAQSSLMRMFAQNKDLANLRLLFPHASSALKDQIALEIGRLGGAPGDVTNGDPNGDSPSSDLVFIGSISSTPDADLVALGDKVRRMNDSSRRVRAYGEYLDRLFAKSPMAAAEWARTSPATMQASASTILAVRWYMVDREGMANWARALPAGQTKDNVFRIWAEQIARTDPDAARSVADEIQDAVLKRHTVDGINRQNVRNTSPQ